MEKLLRATERYILYGTIFLLPVAFANISPNPYIVVKLIILVVGVSLALIVWCVRIFVSGKLEFHRGMFDIPVFIIAATYLASAILKTTNTMEAVLLPGTATAVIGSAILYFLINQHQEKQGFILSLLLSGALFAFVTLLSAFGALESIPQLPQFVKAAGFTPEGGFLPAAIFLLILSVLGIGTTILDKTMQAKVIGGITSIVIVLGLIASIINIVPGSKFAPKYPSLATSWSIAVDSIKDSPILGIGPGNYLTAFSRFRPLSFNQSDLWAVKYATASNFYVTSFTETGLLGIAGIILIIIMLYKKLRKEIRVNDGMTMSLQTIYIGCLLLLLVLIAIFPATLLITFLLFVVLAFTSSSRRTVVNLKTEEGAESSRMGTKLPAILVTIPIFVAVLYIFFKGATIIRAEYTFNTALTYLAQNDAQKTYQYMNQAITENPYVDRYRMTAAQISILLANAIAQKKDISDSDRQTIATLVQSAIEQGKAGVALNPTRSTNWEVLSQVYRAIIPLAKDADQFAIQSATQAIALDPYDPNLRVELGGIYYGQGDFDNAVKVFESAVAAKDDQPNSYYNLAFAYREKGDIDKAVQAMSKVLSLLDKNSQDYSVAQKALEDLQAKQKETSDQKGTELNPPQKNDQQGIEPKINLPKDSAPPTTQVSVTPTTTIKEAAPTVSITPQVTPTLTPGI